MGQLSVTSSELDSMITNYQGTADTNFRVNDGVLQLKDVTDGLYRTVWIQSGTLMIADTGEA